MKATYLVLRSQVALHALILTIIHNRDILATMTAPRKRRFRCKLLVVTPPIRFDRIEVCHRVATVHVDRLLAYYQSNLLPSNINVCVRKKYQQVDCVEGCPYRIQIGIKNEIYGIHE